MGRINEMSMRDILLDQIVHELRISNRLHAISMLMQHSGSIKIDLQDFIVKIAEDV